MVLYFTYKFKYRQSIRLIKKQLQIVTNGINRFYLNLEHDIDSGRYTESYKVDMNINIKGLRFDSRVFR